MSNPIVRELFNSNGLFSYGPLYEVIIPCLEFSIEFQFNNLIYHKEYTKRQQIIYVLIKHLYDEEGLGYRKISQWFNSSVISVLKRKHQRGLRIEEIRNQHLPTKISKLEVNYYIIDRLW